VLSPDAPAYGWQLDRMRAMDSAEQALREAHRGTRRIAVVFPWHLLGMAIGAVSVNIGAAAHNTALVYEGIMAGSLLTAPGLLYVGMALGRKHIAERWHDFLYPTTPEPSAPPHAVAPQGDPTLN